MHSLDTVAVRPQYIGKPCPPVSLLHTSSSSSSSSLLLIRLAALRARRFSSSRAAPMCARPYTVHHRQCFSLCVTRALRVRWPAALLLLPTTTIISILLLLPPPLSSSSSSYIVSLLQQLLMCGHVASHSLHVPLHFRLTRTNNRN